MGIFDFLKRKETDKHTNLTDEDRLLGGINRSGRLEIARRKNELELQLQELKAERMRIQEEIAIERANQELDNLRGDDNGDDYVVGTSMEDTLMAAIAAKVLGGSPQPAAVPQISKQQQITDEEIKTYWNNLDKGIKAYILKLSDQQIAQELQMRMPNISDDEIIRAIQIIRK